MSDRPYWCESCARQKDCYGITLRPKCFVPIADRKTENSSEKPNNCEVKNYCDDCLYTDTCDSKAFFYACTSKATISKMEQVDKDELQSDDVFDYCPRCGMRILSKWAKDEPQAERSE